MVAWLKVPRSCMNINPGGAGRREDIIVVDFVQSIESSRLLTAR